MIESNPASILIAICTLGENKNLHELLKQLCELKKHSQQTIRIVIIWNSTEEVKIPIPVGIEIHFSPVRGYANARNAALHQRRFEESVWFIDDDEIIQLQTEGNLSFEVNPLEIYLSAAAEFPNSIFVGPYRPVDLTGTKLLKDWKGVAHIKHGDTMNFGSGGNLFLPSTIFKKQAISFDPFFNFGGEDTKLVCILARSGIATRWVPSAEIYEKTPPHRFSHEWQNERKKRNYLIHIIIKLESYRFTPIRRLGFAMIEFLNQTFGSGNELAGNLTMKNKMGLFLAITKGDIQRIKLTATESVTNE